MKKTISMMLVLAVACATFGDTYEKGKVYGPIVILGEETVTVDGHGAIIDGGSAARCATLGPNVMLKNFTFRNGKAAVGGGVWGGKVTNCRISGCTATEYGAAVVNCAVSATAITGCTFSLAAAGAPVVHGGIAADSTLDSVTITGCRVEFGTAVPGFGGLAANSSLVNCAVTDNSLVITGDHYGLLFYGGALSKSTVQNNTVDSSATNVVAYMKVTPVDCALDGDRPVPPGPVPPGPTPAEPFDGTVANNYVVTLADGSTLVVSTAKQTVKSGVATCVLTAKLTVGKKTYSYTGGKIENGKVMGLPTCKTSGSPQFKTLTLARDEVSGIFDGDDIFGNRLTKELFADGPEFIRWTAESPLRVGVAYSATLGVSELCGPVKYSASKLPTGLKLDAARGTVTGVPTKANAFKTRVTVTSTIDSKLKAYTEFENEVEVAPLDTWAVGTFYGHGDGCEAKVTVSSVGKVSGTITLAGVKWTVTSTTFDGYANGTYFATLVCKKGKDVRSFRVTVSEDGLVGVGDTQGTNFTGVLLTKENFAAERISWTSESPLRVGVVYSATLGVSELCGPVKYSASKLPSGLKVAQDKASGAWQVTGVPTAAKKFAPKITAMSTIVSSLKAYTDFEVEVDELDPWAIGTFDGGGENCQVKVTVSKQGKISGQILADGLKWTLSGKSFDDYEKGVYYASVTAKNGRTVLPCEISLSADGILGACESSGPFAAQRNCWKEEPWKTLAKKFSKAPVLPIPPRGGGYDANDVIELKFAASGAVTAKGKFVKSYDKRGKPSYYTVSCSTALCPSENPDESGAFSGTVQVYYPPKASTPLARGYVECVTVRWTGSAFVLVE